LRKIQSRYRIRTTRVSKWLFLLLLFTSCSKNQSSGFERLAILPSNVLIADPASEWLRAAIPLVLEADLSTSSKLVAPVANGESAAYEAAAKEAVRTTIEDRNGRYRIEATFTDLSTQQSRRILTAHGKDLLPVVNQLAKEIAPAASVFSTQSDRALKDYATAAQSSNVRDRTRLLEDAVSADPNFGLAYIALLETAAAQGQQAMQPVLAAAQTHSNSFTPPDRARFQAVVARLTHAPLTNQADTLAALLKLTPNNAEALASLGSARFLQGDSAAGSQMFARALQLSPSNSTFIRQFGQGLLETKQFAQAERILDTIPNDPAAVPMLATCALLQGDASRANSIMEKAFARRAPNDPYTVLFRGNWLAISGQIPKAIDYLEHADITDPALHAIAFTQITIWQALSKDFAAAKKSAALASHAPVGAVALLMADANKPPDQWQREVESSPIAASQAGKRLVLGYGYFLSGRYAQAAQIWQDILKSSGNTDLGARAMLAASLSSLGKLAEAPKILVEPFVPELGDLYAAIRFGEMRKFLH
jgi:tetratricopeptide (TPR) repeat protein